MILGSAFALAVVLSALFSGLETGIYTISRLRLHLDADAGLLRAQQARALLADMPGLLTVLLLSNNAANWAASLLAQIALERWEVPQRELVGTLGVTLILFLLAESVPKSAFGRARERLLYPTLPVLLVAHRLLRAPSRPLVAVAALLSRLVARGVGAPEMAAGARELLLQTGAREGFLTSFQARVARGVLAMRGRRAGDEALPLARFPTARVGVPGIRRPEGSREYRALVLDPEGARVIGWVPLAVLAEQGGWRAPRRRELRAVLRVDGAMTLDRALVALDRAGAPFAVVRTASEPAILDAHLLRQRVMGTFAEPAG